MTCTNCGKEISEFAVRCPHCGQECPDKTMHKGVKRTVYDAPSTGFSVLGFFFPFVGFILWLVWKDEMPLRAASAGKGALIAVCVSVGLGILSGIFTACSGYSLI